MGTRKELTALLDVATDANKQHTYIYSDSTIKALRSFATSVPIFTYTDPDLTTVKVVNIGGKPANNVKVFFPAAGFVEITKDGTPLRSETTDGWIELKVLEPSSQCVLKFWTTNYGADREVRVLSDEGITRIKPWLVSREDNKWIVAFDGWELLFFGWILLILLIMLGGVISSVRQRQ